MNPTAPIICRFACCVNPIHPAGLAQGISTPLVSASCVNPAELVGLTQLVYAGQGVTKRIFTQSGLLGRVDEKP